MQAIVTVLALALGGQIAQDGRYTQEGPDAPPTAATADTPAAPAAELSVTNSALPQAGAAAAGSQPVSQQEDSLENPADPASASPLVFQPPAVENEPTIAEAPAQAAGESSVLAAQGPKPSDVMRALMTPPQSGQLAGAATSLSEVVREARSRQDQTERAKAYWDLSAAVGEYYLALLEESELAVLRQGLAAPGTHWDVHQQAARARVEAARRAAIAAQLRLHQLLGRPAAALPLPGDVPHCGRYNAEYEEIFSARPDPMARELSALMPLRYAELRGQAQGIAEAVAWRAQARQQWASASDDEQLLNAQDLVSLRRRAFLATARDYNQEIAAYTELAAPSEVAPDRLVAMMIRTSTGGATAFRTPSDVATASTTEEASSDSAVQPAGGAAARTHPYDGSSPGATAESRTEARKPIRRMLEGRERSVLSAIRRLPQRIRDRDNSR
ncbi:MAG: hypothetical protein DCC67_14485 [Planctomycetota bacterium]|nr:MAG: hypothetical protein DCC67_14485 [Planctomycetota bacterium]